MHAREAVELDQVAVVDGRDDRVLPRLVLAGGLDERGQERHRPDADHEVIEARGPQRFHRKRDDLGVGGRAALADELDARLGELPRLAAERDVLAEDRARVPNAVRPGLLGKPGGGNAGDRDRHLGTEREQAAVKIEEAEGGELGREPDALRERGVLLDDRGLHRSIAPRVEDRRHRRGHRLALGGLLQEHVPEASWRHRPHLLVASSHLGYFITLE